MGATSIGVGSGKKLDGEGTGTSSIPLCTRKSFPCRYLDATEDVPVDLQSVPPNPGSGSIYHNRVDFTSKKWKLLYYLVPCPA